MIHLDYRLVAVVALLGSLVHCKTPGGETDSSTNDSTEADRSIRDQLGRTPTELVAAAERLRDREFESPPEIGLAPDLGERKTEGRPADPIDPVDRATVELLFGSPPAPLPRHGPFGDVARYDHSDHRVEVHPEPPSDSVLEVAILLALVDGLGDRHFSDAPLSTALDRRLAQRAARRADEMLVAAAYLHERRVDSSGEPVAALARRPELALRLDPLSGALGSGNDGANMSIASRSELRNRLAEFTYREGLSMAAALYRAGGWSGVELLHEVPVRSTADVVRPDRWLAGRGLGDWEWSRPSERDPETRRLGPALLALWLGQKFPPKLARTVYSGWRSDAYRFYPDDTRGDAAGNSNYEFDWAHQWDTPTSGRQIAAAFERILNARHGSRDRGDTRWRVVREGLTVRVSIRSAENSSPNEPETSDPDRSSVQFRPREELPLEFVPSRRDTFRTDASRASVDGNSWSDPAARLRVDLGPVEDWTFAESETLPLRWFAKREDGTVFQLSTELADPLAPPFGSERYRTTLRRRFTESLDAAEFTEKETTRAPVDPALHFELTGRKGDEKWTIGVWQFQYGDVVSTFSLQAPAQRYDELAETAREVYESVETLESPPGSGGGDTGESSGSIEYEIESAD